VSGGVSRTVLIIHPGALGDVLLSFPAIHVIRRRYPEHHIVLLARSDIGHLLQVCSVIDRCLRLESGELASLMAGAAHVAPELRSLIRTCTLVVAWLRDEDHSLERTLRDLGAGRIAIGTPTPRAGVHQNRRFLEVLGEAASAHEAIPLLALPEATKQLASDHLAQMGIERGQEYAVCHPGSGSRHKCVQADVMASVAEWLSKQGIAPVVVGGPADGAAVARLAASLTFHVPVIEGQDLALVAGMLAGARIFVGHDSGVTHLAAALGLATVAIFGPTDPRQWAPPGGHVSIVTGPPCYCPTWESVQRCAKPCLSIPADRIVAACSSLLSRYPSVTKY
jgi:heptosyltransferase III